MQVGLGCLKVPGCEFRSKPESNISLRFLFQAPALIFLDEINLFLLKLVLVSVFFLNPRNRKENLNNY